MGCVVSLERQARTISLLQNYINGAQAIELWKDGIVVGYIDMHLMQMHIREPTGARLVYSIRVVEAQQHLIYLRAKNKSVAKRSDTLHAAHAYVRIALAPDSAHLDCINVYVHQTDRKMHKRTWLCCCCTALTTMHAKNNNQDALRQNTTTVVYKIKKWQQRQ